MELETAFKFRNACQTSYKLLSTFRFTINDQPKPLASDSLTQIALENLKQTKTEEKTENKFKVEEEDSKGTLEFVSINNSDYEVSHFEKKMKTLLKFLFLCAPCLLVLF